MIFYLEDFLIVFYRLYIIITNPRMENISSVHPLGIFFSVACKNYPPSLSAFARSRLIIPLLPFHLLLFFGLFLAGSRVLSFLISLLLEFTPFCDEGAMHFGDFFLSFSK